MHGIIHPMGQRVPHHLRTPLIVALVLVAVLPYLQTLRHGFVNFDDGLYVTENPTVLKGVTGPGLIWAIVTFEGGNWHPLTWISHMVDVSLWGQWAGGHHILNPLLHAASAVLLFLIFETMTASFWRSLVLAAFFAAHPLRVESVAWVAERKDVLSVFFGLLAMLCYVRFAQSPNRRHYALVILWMVLSLMCKPMLVTLPFVFLLMDWWPLRRLTLAHRTKTRNIVLEKIPLLAISAAFSVLAVISQGAGKNISSFETLPLATRLANAAVAYGMYLQKLFVPTNLAVFYPHPGQWTPQIVMICSVTLAAITVIALLQWRARPWLAFGWCFFLGTLLPVIGIVQIGLQSMSDRYTYVPTIGVLVMAIWSVPSLQSPLWRKSLSAAAATIVVALVWTSSIQASYWKDSRSLFAHAATVTQKNYLAHQNYGAALEGDGQFAQALEQYQIVALLNPKYAKNRVDMANMLMQLGKLDQAAKELELAIELDPQLSSAYNTLGVIQLSRQQLVEAEKSLRQAVNRDPKNMQAHGNFGTALLQLNRLDEAIVEFRIVKKANPERVGVRTNLAIALANSGRVPEAIAELEQVLQVAPQFAPAINALQQIKPGRPSP